MVPNGVRYTVPHSNGFMNNGLFTGTQAVYRGPIKMTITGIEGVGPGIAHQQTFVRINVTP